MCVFSCSLYWLLCSIHLCLVLILPYQEPKKRRQKKNENLCHALAVLILLLYILYSNIGTMIWNCRYLDTWYCERETFSTKRYGHIDWLRHNAICCLSFRCSWKENILRHGLKWIVGNNGLQYRCICYFHISRLQFVVDQHEHNTIQKVAVYLHMCMRQFDDCFNVFASTSRQYIMKDNKVEFRDDDDTKLPIESIDTKWDHLHQNIGNQQVDTIRILLFSRMISIVSTEKNEGNMYERQSERMKDRWI